MRVEDKDIDKDEGLDYETEVEEDEEEIQELLAPTPEMRREARERLAALKDLNEHLRLQEALKSSS